MIAVDVEDFDRYLQSYRFLLELTGFENGLVLVCYAFALGMAVELFF
jgi:hypothetical protein